MILGDSMSSKQPKRRWRIHGDGKSFSRDLTWDELEHFKETGELPKVGALPIGQLAQPV